RYAHWPLVHLAGAHRGIAKDRKSSGRSCERHPKTRPTTADVARREPPSDLRPCSRWRRKAQRSAVRRIVASRPGADAPALRPALARPDCRRPLLAQSPDQGGRARPALSHLPDASGLVILRAMTVSK